MTPSVTPSNKSKIHHHNNQSITDPIIDKISITVHPATQQLRDEIFTSIWQVIDASEYFADARKSRDYYHATFILIPGSTERVYFQFGPRKPDYPFCRLEFNPHKLGINGMNELHSTLSLIFPEGWGTVLQYGRVSRIDVAVDLVGLQMDQFHFLPQTGCTSRLYGRNGLLETLYSGSSRGNQTRVYDRTAEHKSRKQKLPGPPTVRVERCLRNPGIPLSKLASLKNPFEKMVLIPPMPERPDGVSETKWAGFLDSARVRGLPAALQLQSPAVRAQFRKHVKSAPLPLWDPVKVWEDWPVVVSALVGQLASSTHTKSSP